MAAAGTKAGTTNTHRGRMHRVCRCAIQNQVWQTSVVWFCPSAPLRLVCRNPAACIRWALKGRASWRNRKDDIWRL